MLGSALFTTVTSSSNMNTAMQTTPSVHHLLSCSLEVGLSLRWIVDMGAVVDWRLPAHCRRAGGAVRIREALVSPPGARRSPRATPWGRFAGPALRRRQMGAAAASRGIGLRARAARGVAQIVARPDPELREHLAQVPLDGARTDEELGADLGIRPPIGGEARDLSLLRGELVTCLDAPLAHRLAGSRQLSPSALGEAVHSHGGVGLMRGAQLHARLDPPALPAQPLAVQEVRSRERYRDTGAAEPLDRLTVEALSLLALAHERPRARRDAQRPVGSTRAADLLEPSERRPGALGQPRAHGRLDELRRHPRRQAELVGVRGGPLGGRECVRV